MNPTEPVPISRRLRTRLRWYPLAILLAGTALIHLFDIDRRVTALMHEDGTWIGDTLPWCGLLYDYGPSPALTMGILSLGLLVYSIRSLHLSRHRRLFLFYAASLLLGPGLLVNTVFKENFGRPRPSNTVDYGGEYLFHPVGQPGIPPKGNSFPTGHGSMGYYLMSPFFVLLARRRRLACGFLALGLLAGTAIGFVRILQGDHWVSDILWAAGFVYYTCLLVATALGFLRVDPGEARLGKKGYTVLESRLDGTFGRPTTAPAKPSGSP